MIKKQQKTPKQNKALLDARKRIIIQAIIAVQTIVITVVLIFGMSVAWYTNVIQTSGLQFEAAAWGFTGQVTVAEEPVQASPGKSDIIGLHVSNAGDTLIDVAVYVSKEQMEVPMRQRLFFYVDAADTRSEETMERVYINTRESYTYSLLSHSELVLTQERTNDAPLKWQWVYDMLGYYFVGTVTETVGDDNTKVVVPDVEDYLRPVEYELDNATFLDGVLETVDGVTTLEFLEQLSRTDGYQKDITPTQMQGYYQVDVDENGYGVWMYLCNWAEIQQATTYDSQLGKAATEALANGDQAQQFVARLTVVGQMTQPEYKEVTTEEQLVKELNSGVMVKLQQDMVLTEPIDIDSSVKTVMDMNGHKITGPEDSSALQLSNAANLTIMNGEIFAQDATRDVISVSNSVLTFSNMKISGEGDDAIDIADQNGDTDSCVRLFDSEIDVAGCSVFIRGNGTVSEGKTQVVVENSKLNSGYVAVMGNGSEAFWGTNVQIYQSELTGYYAAIYQPQGDSITKVTDSTLVGGTGVVIKGGQLEILSSGVKGVGEASEPQYEVSGFSETGDAVFIDCSYHAEISVTISGDSAVTSANNLAVRVFVPGDSTNNASVVITGGTFSSDVSAFVPAGYVFEADTNKVSRDETEAVTETVAEEGAGNGE